MFKELEDSLKCPICFDFYKTPKVLPCSHTICLAPCLMGLLNEKSNRIKCPYCRTVFKISRTAGLNALPSNLILIEIIELLEKSNNTDRCKSNNRICTNCLLENESSIECYHCSKWFCSNCKSNHFINYYFDLNCMIFDVKQRLVEIDTRLKKASEGFDYELIEPFKLDYVYLSEFMVQKENEILRQLEENNIEKIELQNGAICAIDRLTTGLLNQINFHLPQIEKPLNSYHVIVAENSYRITEPFKMYPPNSQLFTNKLDSDV